MDRGAWQATDHGIARVRHDLVTKPPLKGSTSLLCPFLTLCWVTSSHWLEMGFGGSIYTTETGKCYRLELLYHHPSKNWLLNFYQHTTQQRSYVTGMKTERSRITLVKAGVASPHQTLPQSRRMRFVPALNAVSLSDKPQRRHRKEKVFAPDKQASFLYSPKFHDKYKSQYSQSWPAFQPIRVS